MLGGCWIQTASSNSSYFDNTIRDDIIIRSDMKEHNIFISPIKTASESATMCVGSNAVIVVGDVSVSGSINANRVFGECISSAVNSYSSNIAASSGAIKTAYDLAAGASNVANVANVAIGTLLPKIGGIVTGDIILSGVGTQLLGDSLDDVGNPSFSWTGDVTTGVYKAGAGAVGITTSGVNRATIDSNGLTVSGALVATSLSGACISSVVNSYSSNIAASSGAVKTAYDLAAGASNVANVANVAVGNMLPKIGGTVTGDIILSGVGTQVLGDTVDSVLNPSFSWNTDEKTGIYRIGAGSVGISTLGVNRATIDSIGVGVVGNLSGTSLSGTCISSVTNSTATNVAATSSAVKTAYDLAMGANVNSLFAASNLSDIGNVAKALSNIGLGSNNSVSFSNVSVTGDFYKNGVLFEGGSGGLDFTSISSNVIPTINNTYDLGTENLRWRNLYLGGNAISFGDGTVVNTTNWNYLTNYILPTQQTITSRKLMDGSSQFHSAFISNGTVYVFGKNESGQLGLNDTASRFTPQPIKSITIPAVAVAVGADFTVVVLQDGTAVAFGNNGSGQLGDGTSIKRYTPVVVTGLPVGKLISSVSVGQSFVIYLMTDGTAYGFGSGELGQLGNGLSNVVNTTSQQFIIPTSGISAGSPIARIICGSYHTVAILQNGVTVLSGSNTSGQLGSDPSVVTRVLTPGPLANFGPCVSAACGNDFTILIKDDGTVASMGNNTYGQLGRTGVSYTITNVAGISNEINNGTSIAANRGLSMKVSAGFEHTVVVSYTGKVYVFGRNTNGQLGIGPDTTSVATPTLLSSLSSNVVNAIACGKYHTLVMVVGDVATPANSIFGFGLNANGQLGDLQNEINLLGVPANQLVSIRWFPVSVLEDDKIKKIKIFCSRSNSSSIVKNNTVLSSGFRYGLTSSLRYQPETNGLENISVNTIGAGYNNKIILDNTGKLYTWGYNFYGQLGDGTTVNKNKPTLINTGAIADKVIVSIAVGYFHTMALDNTGKVYAWGNNGYGQLGNGNTTQQNTPILINTGAIADKVIVSIVCGGYHTMVLDNTGKVYAWGLNTSGQLGNDNTAQQNTPVLINTGAIANKVIVSIACGWAFTTALDNTGKVYGCGYNGSGQLGDDTTVNKNTLILINTGAIANKVIVSVSCGSENIIFLDNSGKLYSCGNNLTGQLGNGNTTQQNTPILINTGAIANKIIVSIACVGYNTMVLDNNNNVYTWGYNLYGQLGDGTVVDKYLPILVSSTIFDPDVTTPIVSKGYSNHKLLYNRPDKTVPSAIGDNAYGQLGDGSVVSKTSQVNIVGLTNQNITSAANGEGFSAMVINGYLWTWGRNESGQCGFDPVSTPVVAYPTKLTVFTDALKVVCGGNFLIVQTVSGIVFRIGARIGTTGYDYIPIIQSEVTAVEIAAGESHAVIINTAGEVYTWGLSTYGQTGRTVSTTSPTIIPKSTFNYANATKVACGSNHTIIIFDDGSVYTTGFNTSGQLGRVLNISHQVYFKSMDNTLGIGEIFTTNASDSYSTLFTKYGTEVYFYLIGQDGVLYRMMFKTTTTANSRTVNVWKSSDGGATFVAGASFPVATDFLLEPAYQLEEISEWELSSNWSSIESFGKILPYGKYGIPVQVSCGYNFSSILLNTGVVVTFGDNTKNQNGVVGSAVSSFKGKIADTVYNFFGINYLESGGNSTYATSNDSIIRNIKVLGEYNTIGVSKIGSGYSHTIILDNSGKLYAWGKNTDGQLGDGTNNQRNDQILINTGGILNKVIVSIVCGGIHSTALDNTGKVYAWGANGDGQLGDGTNVYKNTSTLINTGAIANKVIVSIACGYSHTIALDNTGKVYAWGANGDGQLGDGTSGTGTNKNTPILINTGAIMDKIIVSIACGSNHTIALDNNGNLYAWGKNIFGQLGDGTNVFKNTPILINRAIINNTIVSITCGGSHTIALDNTGKVYIWGYNRNGEFGDGTNVDKNIPTLINNGDIANKVIVSILGGYNHTIAIDNTGKLYSWGYNGKGQVGNGNTTNQYNPILINTGDIANKLIVYIACGQFYTMALDNTGKLYAWGDNGVGQLGDGTITQRNTPILIITQQTTGSQVILNFTGQHRCLLERESKTQIDLTGLVVVSDKNKYITSDMKKRYRKLEIINDALPVVSLSSKKADKAVFGVISQGIDLGMRLEDNKQVTSMVNYSDSPYKNIGDNRLQINSIGEGCIWVIEDELATILESGDCVMTSDTPGYSTLQPDDFMRSYTIAKLTSSCDWNPQQVPVEITKTDIYGNFIHDAEGRPIFENVVVAEFTDVNGDIIPEHVETEDEYTIRYVNVNDGSIESKEAWMADPIAIKRAALIGCTYHCG